MAPTESWAPEPRAPTEFGDQVPARKENDDECATIRKRLHGDILS
jgi:hypothetical protein